MRSKIQKWGNSLAIRIPKPFAEEVGVKDDADVDIRVEGDRLVVAPLARPSYELADLLKGVSDENIHGEVDAGPPVGNESW